VGRGGREKRVSDSEASGAPPQPPPRLRRWGTLPWIWAVPIIAAAITVWLGLRTIADKGPLITISFASAEGIDLGRNEAGHTAVRYKNVELGRVVGLGLSPDRSQVIVSAEMRREAEPLLRRNTEFWVVRPRIEPSGISGLNTLVSGAYIGMLPGEGEAGARSFRGLENPPPQQGLVKGTGYTLVAERLPPISDGAPVYFHGVKVGEVIDHALSDADGKVVVRIFIYNPHSGLIHAESLFWISAGIEAGLGAEGLQVKTETLQTLLTGGIIFDTPMAVLSGEPSLPETRFVLHSDRKTAEDAADPLRVSYRVVLPGSLHGLAVGAPVELRGIRIGRVAALHLEYDKAADAIRIPATIEIAPHRIVLAGEPPLPDNDPKAAAEATNRLFRRLIAKGLRARLASDNLLIGSRVVELDFVADAAPAQLGENGTYPELPAVAGSGLDEVARSATAFLDKLAALPLPELIGSLREMVRHADAVVAAPALRRSVRQLDRTLANAEQLTRDARVQAGPLLVKLNAAAEQLNSTLALLGNDPRSATDLAHTLAELKDAARSVRLLADMLERHPEALLRGRSREAAR
jgi:paraquat-inducible protein B